MPTSAPSDACEFRFRLKNTHRIEQLKVNEKFVRPAKEAPGEYIASLPATASTKPIPLIKYLAAAKWRPVPLFVDVSVIEDAVDAGSGELQAVVQANAQLKTPLHAVSLTVAPPPSIKVDGTRAVLPEGSRYDASAGVVAWDVCKQLQRETPITCSAVVSTQPDAEGGDALERLRGALMGVSFDVKFDCEGVTISGIELEVHAAVATMPSPIAKILRRFAAGEYKVLVAPASASPPPTNSPPP